MKSHWKWLCCVLLPCVLVCQQALGQPIDNWDNSVVKACQRLQPQATNCSNALVERNIEDITFSAPIIITKGGTYSGAWLSEDSNISPVTIRTPEPVEIKDSIIAGAGNLIYGRNVNAQITNVAGFGIGDKPGKFLDLTVADTLSVSTNRMSNVWGMRVSGTDENSETTASLLFKNNIAYNIRDGQENAAHFIQLVNGIFLGAEISNNIALNAPWKSHVEDVINLYNARGTKENPIMVNDNIVIGAYPKEPSKDGYSGGGIIIDGSADATPLTASQHIIVENNTVIATTNYGIAIAAGNNNILRNNKVVSSGMVTKNIPAKAQNVGAYIWNIYKQPNDTFYDNKATRNKIFWMKVKDLKTNLQEVNHTWLPDCSKKPGSCSNDVISTSHMLKDAIVIETDTVRSALIGEQ